MKKLLFLVSFIVPLFFFTGCEKNNGVAGDISGTTWVYEKVDYYEGVENFREVCTIKFTPIEYNISWRYYNEGKIMEKYNEDIKGLYTFKDNIIVFDGNPKDFATIKGNKLYLPDKDEILVFAKM